MIYESKETSPIADETLTPRQIILLYLQGILTLEQAEQKISQAAEENPNTHKPENIDQICLEFLEKLTKPSESQSSDN